MVSVKLPFDGFYESSHDAVFDAWFEFEGEYLQSECEATLEQVQELGELWYKEIDWKKLHEDYAREYVEAVERLINTEQYKIKVKLEFESLESPREYNFSTDCIYVKIDDDVMLGIFRDLDKEKFSRDVKDKYTSYPGFSSFYSPDWTEWESSILEWGEARLSTVLECWFGQIGITRDNLKAWELMESFQCNGGIDYLIFKHASQVFKDKFDVLENKS